MDGLGLGRETSGIKPEELIHTLVGWSEWIEEEEEEEEEEGGWVHCWEYMYECDA